MNTAPIIVGLSAFHHDSAACVLRGDQLVCAVEEERFTRIKHQGGVPVHAFRWCLDRAGVQIGDIDAIAVGLDPDALADRRSAMHTPSSGSTTTLTEAHLRQVLGVEAPIRFVPHHLAHAASAYHFSEFETAAIVVVDGVGEWETTSIWSGIAGDLTQLAASRFPHSLGFFYAAVTSWLGFRVNHDEYKVMGLAAWGKPLLVGVLEEMVPRGGDGLPELDMSYFAFLDERRMYSDSWLSVLGPARRTGEPLTAHHHNVAASAQAVLERWMLDLVQLAYDRTKAERLCVAGGVGLNAVANGRVAREGPFDQVFFQPVAGDAGTALGAASITMNEFGGPRPAPLVDLRLGPSYGRDDISKLLDALDIAASSRREDDSALIDDVAARLEQGQIVGWFEGAAEFGPRALGARSILGDPRSATARDRINLMLKNREGWRPLAPIVAEADAATFFSTARPLRFMIETVDVKAGAGLDAVTHIDGTARPQMISAITMPRLSALLAAFQQRTGVPVLINTSFNHASEPIVSTPAQALLAACRLGLDALVLGDFLVTDLRHHAADLVRQWQVPQAPSDGDDANLYPM